MPKPTKQQLPSLPLETRHVFLDTEAYRSVRYNVANPALMQLAALAKEERVVLHVTDVGIMEAERQLREDVDIQARDLAKVDRELRRFRGALPNAQIAKAELTGSSAIAQGLVDQFKRFLRDEFLVQTVHQALKIDPKSVFDAHFTRQPPFDKPPYKEFPDGFMIAALEEWCIKHDKVMYVVGRDQAMQRAAKNTSKLLVLDNINELLERAGADLTPEQVDTVEAAFHAPAFDDSFELLLAASVAEAPFIYVGDLHDGEAYEGELMSIQEADDWTVLDFGHDRFTVILEANVLVNVAVGYYDTSEAFWDKEDGVWFGATNETTEVDEIVRLRVLATVKRTDGSVTDVRLLGEEIVISGPHDDLY